MAAITAQAVAQLRERTGLGMMECKKALTEANGDMDEAIRLIREKGGKDRGARVASEGIVMAGLSDDKRRGVLVELNSETDFVARNEEFKALARLLAEKVISYGPGTVPASVDALLADTMNGSGTVAEKISEAASRIGEKLVLGRFQRFGAPEGNVVAAYIHNPSGSGSEGGKIGTLVELTGADEATLSQLGREVAIHIASANPRFLSEAEVDPAVLESEREIVRAQAANDPKMKGKPQQVIDSMVNGRLRKFFEETVLLNQPYVRDDKRTVGALVKETSGASIVRFVRFKVGETVARPAADGAAA